MINAAFNFNLDSAGKTIKEARVVYGLPGAPVHCLVDIAGETLQAFLGQLPVCLCACVLLQRVQDMAWAATIVEIK